MVWIVVASVLAAFKVDKRIDERGKEVAVEDEYKDGLISYVSQDYLRVSTNTQASRHPVPFEYQISPRHEGVVRLLEETSEAETERPLGCI